MMLGVFMVQALLKLLLLACVAEAIQAVVEEKLQFCAGQLQLPDLMEACSCQTGDESSGGYRFLCLRNFNSLIKKGRLNLISLSCHNGFSLSTRG